MLETILASLRELSLVGPKAKVSWSVTFTVGDVLHLSAYADDGQYYHVRISEKVDLEAEFSEYVRAFQAYSAFAPEPLAYRRSRDLQWIVFPGVDAKPVVEADVLSMRSSSPLGRGLLSFFRRSRENQQGRWSRAEAGEFLSALDRRFATGALARASSHVLSVVELNALAELPRSPQHGDFSFNNLALAKSGLVVFDWEDFGRVWLSGFDLAVLIASAVRFEPAEIATLFATNSRLGKSFLAWVGDSCEVLGIDVDVFKDTLPLYLLQFLSLKDLYSPPIRRRVELAILALVGA